MLSPSRLSKFRSTREPILLVAAVLSFLGLALSGSAAQDGVDGARSILEKWVETERLISKEDRDWQLGKESLTDRIGLIEREIQSFRERIASNDSSITTTDSKKQELVEENAGLKSAAAALGEVVGELELRTLALLKSVPAPLRAQVKPLSQRIPEPGKESKSTLSERFQNVVGVLNQVNKYHREINVATEVRDLGNGQEAEVTALYLGISCGYYVTNDERAAGIGVPGAEGFVWTPKNEEAANIAKAIRVLRNEEPATFIPLPMSIQ